MSEFFNQSAYWKERHQKYKGDPRSVGNLGRSLSDNLVGEQIFKSDLRQVVSLLAGYQNVLDIGCGYGRSATVFCDSGFDYTGVDISPVAIAAARKAEPRGTFITGSALDVDLTKTFDVVCVFYVFVHFVEDQAWEKLISKIAKLLNRGGALLFADHFSEEIETPARHVRSRPIAMYETVFRNVGLELDLSFFEPKNPRSSDTRQTGNFKVAKRPN